MSGTIQPQPQQTRLLLSSLAPLAMSIPPGAPVGLTTPATASSKSKSKLVSAPRLIGRVYRVLKYHQRSHLLNKSDEREVSAAHQAERHRYPLLAPLCTSCRRATGGCCTVDAYALLLCSVCSCT